MPARKTANATMVVVSPAEKVAVWQGMHRMPFAGNTRAATPK
jgi:hypothetical protein